MFDFPSFFNLGDLSAQMARFAGIWAMVNAHMNIMRNVGLSVWLFVSAYAFYERFRQSGEDPLEYIYQMLRSGLALGAITFWPDLFNFFRQAFNTWADAINWQAPLQQILTSLAAYALRFIAFSLLGPAGLVLNLPFFIFIAALLFFLFAYIYLLVYQTVAMSVAFIFGPVALALYPSRTAGAITAGFLKSTIKILMLPLLFAIFLEAFTRVSADLFRARDFGLIQSAVLVLIAYLTLKLPRILDRLDTTLDTAGHFAGGLMVMASTAMASWATGIAARGTAAVAGAAGGPAGMLAASVVGGTASAATARISSALVRNPVRGRS